MAKPRNSSRRRKPVQAGVVREVDDGSGPEFFEALTGTLDRINDHLVTRRGDVSSIMVVEDDDDARDILASVLEHAGYVTICVSNGNEAVATLRKVRPSLIILDLRMPEMDGWSVDRYLKSEPQLRGIPVIIVSAFANLSASRTGVGADAWFQKPIDLTALLRALPQLLTSTFENTASK